jgi:hypothetical protein
MMNIDEKIGEIDFSRQLNSETFIGTLYYALSLTAWVGTAWNKRSSTTTIPN